MEWPVVVGEAGQLVSAVGEFCGFDLEEIAGADGVPEHFLKIGRGDAARRRPAGPWLTAQSSTSGGVYKPA